MQRKTTFSPILFENFDFYFGEWDHKGKFIYRHLLFNTPETWHCPAAYDENFWVRIGGRHASMLPSIVEVVDRVLQSMKTFELPLSTEEVVFSKAHISKNQLFFAKNKIDHATGLRRNPTICIFDLIGGVLLHEFPCRDNGGSPECLVANRHYVAWIEQTRILQVKYLDLATKLVEVEFTLTHLSFVQIQLNLSEIFLTATYLLRHGGINRAVIDLRNGNLQYNVMYNASIRDDFSFSNGNLLIAVRDRGLYIESFLGDGQQREGEYRAM